MQCRPKDRRFATGCGAYISEEAVLRRLFPVGLFYISRVLALFALCFEPLRPCDQSSLATGPLLIAYVLLSRGLRLAIERNDGQISPEE